MTPSSSKDTPFDQNFPPYLTPRETPESIPEAPPVGETQLPTTIPIQSVPQQVPQDIVGDVTTSNIIERTRTRKKSEKARQQAYFADLQKLEELPAYHAAFTAGIQQSRKRFHCDELPPPPRAWKDLSKHSHGRGFRAAAIMEYENLKHR